MTADEFQKKYHDYSTEDEMQAISDSIKANNNLVGAKCVPIKIGNKYCLMLDTAHSFLKEIGVL